MSISLRKLCLAGLLAGTVAIHPEAQTAAHAPVSQLRRPITPLMVAGPQSTVDDELHAMFQQAAVIFSGRVVSVQKRSAADSPNGWVEVQFQIEQAVRGCLGQSSYMLREWSGLWSRGVQYKVGQQFLMLLHAPSASGLSSPVGGQDGAIPVNGGSPAPGPNDTFTVSPGQSVDLRWIQTRVLRSAPPTTPSSPVHPILAVGKAQEPLVTRKVSFPVQSEPQDVDESVASTGLEGSVNQPVNLSQGITLRNVLSMMHAWEAKQADAAQ